MTRTQTHLCRRLGSRMAGIGSVIRSQGELLDDLAYVAERAGPGEDQVPRLDEILGMACHSSLRDCQELRAVADCIEAAAKVLTGGELDA